MHSIPTLPRPRPTRGTRPLVCAWLVLAALVVPGAAGAVDISGKLEPGVAVPLTAPQSTEFGVGASQSLKLLFGVLPYLDVGPSASFTILPSNIGGKDSGVVWTLGGGARLKWPHDSEELWGLSPWIDADALYVRTGELHRPGFDVAVGVSLPLDDNRTFRLGPFVRYLHVMQIDRVGEFDNRDAKLLMAGLSLEFGSGVERARAPLVEPLAREPTVAEPTVVTRDVEVCSDRDTDGVPDTVDRCPDVFGTTEAWGCPNYQKIIVRPDKLELKEKLYFAWDAATLEPASFPILDEVVQALKDNRGFKVQIEGHTDSTGGNDHNQTLSEQRAAAVLDYLSTHGIAKERLVSKGFSDSVPTDTNTTVEGRENNRRVEFVVSFILLNKASTR